MRLMDERNQIRFAISDWIRSYGLDRTYAADKRGRMVGTELQALDPDKATREEVAEIIGNDNRVSQTRCSECGVKSWGIVEVGEFDFDCDSTYLCESCLEKALNLVRGEV